MLRCPLDKFAVLWPAIVPISTQSLTQKIRWVNVADGLDIVANELQYFPTEPAPAGGLKLENHSWHGTSSPLTAHTSYWIAKPGRLMDWIVRWLEDEGCPGPDLRPAPRQHKLYLFLWQVLLGFVVFLMTSAALTILWTMLVIHWYKPNLNEWAHLTWLITQLLICGSGIVVFVFSLYRRIDERREWGPQK